MSKPKPTRRCRRCGIEKPVGEFRSRGQICEVCRAAPSGKPRRCFDCAEVKPADAFPYPTKRRKRVDRPRRSPICRDCWKARAQAAARRRRRFEAKRATWVDEDGRSMRRCSACGEVKELTRENFYLSRRPSGRTPTPTEYQYTCCTCTVKRTSAYNRRKTRDPDPNVRAEVRAQRYAWAKAWRLAHPKAYKASQRRYRRSVLSDPVRHARQLENGRFNYRLRRIRAGLPMRTKPLLPARGPRLPAAPLAEVIARGNGVYEERALAEGINPRELYAWRSGERKTILASKADALLVAVGLNWWDVWWCDEHDELTENCPDCEGVRIALRAF